jgi:hypothetical protein
MVVIPPPYEIIETPDGEVYGIDLSQGVIHATTKYDKIQTKMLRLANLAHEYLHGSLAGIPSTFIEGKKIEARFLKDHIPVHLANIIADIVNDTIQQRDYELQQKNKTGKGFNFKDSNEEWFKINITIGDFHEGDYFHLLHILGKALFGEQIPPTRYEKEIMTSAPFRQTIELLNKLIAEQYKLQETKDIDLITQIAELIETMVKKDANKDSNNSKNPSRGGAFGSVTPQEQVGAVAAIGISMGLSPGDMETLINNPKIPLSEALKAGAEALGRKFQFEGFIGFDSIINSPKHLTTPLPTKWHGSPTTLNPISVNKHPSIPSLWQDNRLSTPYTPLNNKEHTGGFKEIIILEDVSGSTSSEYNNTRVYIQIARAAIAGITFARMHNLPFTLIPFEYRSIMALTRSKNYEKGITRALQVAIDCGGGTNLRAAIANACSITPEKAGIIIITDGEVLDRDVPGLTLLTKENNVFVLLVSSTPLKSPLMNANNIEIYQVPPDKTAITLIQSLGKHKKMI